MMRTCRQCLAPHDRFCPMCGECVDCCECQVIAIRGGRISQPAYAGQYTDDYRRQQGRWRAWGTALVVAAILGFVYLWKIGVLR